MRIAIADDDPLVLGDLKDMLLTLGHEVVVTAKTGRELVSGCRSASPELLVSDIKMPELDGISAAAEVCRENPIPVILVSSHHEPELLDRASENDVFAYLAKPINEDLLITSMGLAKRRFENAQKAAGGRSHLFKDLELIARAEQILTHNGDLEHREAFERFRAEAREQHERMVLIAERIIDWHKRVASHSPETPPPESYFG